MILTKFFILIILSYIDAEDFLKLYLIELYRTELDYREAIMTLSIANVETIHFDINLCGNFYYKR